MKTFPILFTLFSRVAVATLLLPTVLQAQNWEPVHFSETANYTVEGADSDSFLYMYPYASDSNGTTGRFLPDVVAEIECPENYPCQFATSCKYVTSPFLQEFAMFMPGGIVEFQNPDTFRMHCNATLAESWIFKTDSTGNDVFAHVSELLTGSILGQPDSIKIITVDDGTIIHLSKHHGIIYYLDSTHNFELNSIPSRGLGGSSLSNADVFNFNQGDVFVYLHKSQDIHTGFNDSEITSRSVIRHDVLEVNQSNDTLTIMIQDSRFTSTYINSEGNGSIQTSNDTLLSTIYVPLNEDCHVYSWPVGGPLPALVPTQILEIFRDFVPSIYGCSSFEPALHCSEHELLGGDIALPNLTRLTTGVFGDRSLLTSSINFNGGPSLDPNSSLIDVFNQDPADFYEKQTLNRCTFNQSLNPAQIETGEILGVDDDPFGWQTTGGELFALGGGLGIVAFIHQFTALSSWCSEETVMIGYQKQGEDSFGYIPTSTEILSLTTSNALANSPFNVYPNPATSTVSLDLSGGTLIRASLHDMQGRQVLVTQINHNSAILDVSSLPKGTYLLRATSQNGAVYVKKLMVD